MMKPCTKRGGGSERGIALFIAIFTLLLITAIATGMTKVGCFLGDHTKTGLGTLLNTGTNVGAFCNLLPAGLPSRSMRGGRPSRLSWTPSSPSFRAPAFCKSAK